MYSKIISHLWFNDKAQEATEFYITLFDNSKIIDTSPIQDTTLNDIKVVDFVLDGTLFEAIDMGPDSKHSTAVSLMVYCESTAEIFTLWSKLKIEGVIHRQLGLNTDNKFYACLEDRYGIVWQLVTSSIKPSQKISPSISFSGRAQEAVVHYGDIFPKSVIKFIDHQRDASMMFAQFQFDNFELSCIDVEHSKNPGFNQSFSFKILCEDQEEIDFFWHLLSADPSAEQSGWLKDKFGLSWQIIPNCLNKMLKVGSELQRKALRNESLRMKKINIHKLKQAYNNHA